jgi:hypothetical protein
MPGRASILEDEKFLRARVHLMKRIIENRCRVTECAVSPTLMPLPNQGCLNSSLECRKPKPAYEWAGAKPPTTSCREGSECSCHHARDPGLRCRRAYAIVWMGSFSLQTLPSRGPLRGGSCQESFPVTYQRSKALSELCSL